MSAFDVVAGALLAVCAYGGYRRGLLAIVLHLTGGLLAVALAVALAPLLAPWAARLVDVPLPIARPAAVVVLGLVLRVVFGYAVREVVTLARGALRAVPPLRLADQILGIGPGLALGAVVVLAIALAALNAPLDERLRAPVASSWVVRTVISRPEETLAVLRRLWDELVVSPSRLSALPLAAGVSGLWLAAFAVRGLGPRTGAPPTPRRSRPRRSVPPAAVTADPVPVVRAVGGVVLAGALMAALLVVGRL
jgi:uncharacterized membrane protein required for colicin V production